MCFINKKSAELLRVCALEANISFNILYQFLHGVVMLLMVTATLDGSTRSFQRS